MSTNLTGLRVFIASPGGLKEERSAFKEVIDRINHDSAHEAGITFVPSGWEYTSAGIGRPQEKINEQVRESDYMLVMLWDQWGSATGRDPYTSGTEEEYEVALKCLKDENRSMRDIVVLFKGVNDRQLADPGRGLEKVLAFKRQLEESHGLLYSTFDTLDEFRDDLRQHLHQWIRDWQGDGPPAKTGSLPENKPLSNATVPQAEEPEASDANRSVAQLAKTAADRGRFTTAEQLFARATTGAYDQEAFTEYVRFLRKRGRLNLAQIMAHSFLDQAQDADDLVGEIEALANLAMLDRQQGQNATSLEYMNRAIAASNELIASLGPTDSPEKRRALGTKAFLLDNLSLTLRRMPQRSEDALDALRQAQAVQEEVGDARGKGFTLRNYGALLYRLGHLDEAEKMLLESLELFAQVEYASGQATALASLGEVYEAMGDPVRAIESLDRSIAVTPTRTPSRLASNYAALARLQAHNGSFEKARDYADLSMRAAQDLGTPESMATALLAKAQVDLATGDNALAGQELQEARVFFQQVDNQVGVAAVLIDLARTQIAETRLTSADLSLSQAEELLQSAPHYGLDRELSDVRSRLLDLRE